MSRDRAMASKRATAAVAVIAGLGLALACKRVGEASPSAGESGATPSATASAATPPPVAGATGEAAVGSASLADISVPGASTVTYVATNYAFDGPRSLPAGLTTFRLENHGTELHHLVIFKLNGGKSEEDLVKAMQAEGSEGRLPDWAVFEGGPAGIAPGAESNATLVLDPGNYALVCFIPSSDGMPHMAKGMMEPLEVVAEKGAAAAPEPQADLTVKLVDYDFQMPESLTTGRHVVRVDNAGIEPHELVIWQLPPGKSLADVIAWVDGGLSGPPTGRPVAGLSPVGAGGHAYFVMDLPPGDYALICFVPDEGDGKPHYDHGMAKQITVN
jgi:uncharacterized cupredoxin-like copper-binding protein